MKLLLFVLGWMFFVIGLVGVFVPLLPTTPFILLAAACFSNSSDRFYDWLLELPLMGESLRSWQQHRVIALKAKLLATFFIALAMTYVSMTSPASPVIKAIMIITGVIVLIFIWIQKSKKNKGE